VRLEALDFCFAVDVVGGVLGFVGWLLL